MWSIWYLTEETIGLAFFYDGIPAEQKVKMAKAYKGEKKNT